MSLPGSESQAKSHWFVLSNRLPTLVLALLLITPGPLSGRAAGQEEATEIVVTANSDEENGDTSSVEALQTNPGPDGISLREAIEVTNKDSGTTSILFSTTLKGATIEVNRLPHLVGGNVSINGDIDSDGVADVTLQGPESSADDFSNVGFAIKSSGNTLHAVGLKGFFHGVTFSPSGSDGIYSGNVVSNLSMDEIDSSAIIFGTHSPGNQWIDTAIVDNNIRSRGGIAITLGNNGDRVDGIRIEGNSIRIYGQEPGECAFGGGGVGLAAGEGNGSNNVIRDALIANNSIRGNVVIGVRLASGSNGGDSNLIENISVLDNHVDMPVRGKVHCMSQGVMVGNGDGGAVSPGTEGWRPNDNVTRHVEISGNTLLDGQGVWVFAGGSGGLRSKMSDLRITNNTIEPVGALPGINIYSGGGPEGTATRSTRLSNVVVDSNRITIVEDDKPVWPAFGGIDVTAGDFGGWGSVTGTLIKGVRISNNVIDTRMPGISLVGGQSGWDGRATENVLVDVVLTNNRIPRAPRAVSGVYERGVRGIRMVGGIHRMPIKAGYQATGNRVSCVRLRRNRVAGVKNAVSTVANLFGARNNRARLAC